jgi:hypothetical protein
MGAVLGDPKNPNAWWAEREPLLKMFPKKLI